MICLPKLRCTNQKLLCKCLLLHARLLFHDSSNLKVIVPIFLKRCTSHFFQGNFLAFCAYPRLFSSYQLLQYQFQQLLDSNISTSVSLCFIHKDSRALYGTTPTSQLGYCQEDYFLQNWRELQILWFRNTRYTETQDRLVQRWVHLDL